MGTIILAILIALGVELYSSRRERGFAPLRVFMLGLSVILGLMIGSLLSLVVTHYAPESWWSISTRIERPIAVNDLAYCYVKDGNSPRCVLKSVIAHAIAPGDQRWKDYHWKLVESDGAKAVVVTERKRLLLMKVPFDLHSVIALRSNVFDWNIAELRMPTGTYAAWQQLHPEIREAEAEHQHLRKRLRTMREKADDLEREIARLQEAAR